MSEFLPEEENNSRSFLIPLLLIFFGVLLGGSFLYLKSTYPSLFTDSLNSIKSTLSTKQKIVSEKTTNPTTLPQPSVNQVPVILPHESQTYNFSHGDQVKGPRPSSITLDPLALNPDESQTITIKASYFSEITRVKIELLTDNKTSSLELKQIDGTSTDGTWQGTWNNDDTTDNRFIARLILESNQDNYDNNMRFK